jgi:hypothetical protein
MALTDDILEYAASLIQDTTPDMVRERVGALLQELAVRLGQAQLRSGGKNGDELWALCPYHDDHRVGSFSVNSAHGRFFCFACGAQGTVLKLAKKILPAAQFEQLSGWLKPEHLHMIRPVYEEDGMFPLPDSLLHPFIQYPARLIAKNHPVHLLKTLDVRLDHLHNRIIFPVRNSAGQLVGIQSRALDDSDVVRWKWYREEIEAMLGLDFMLEHGLEDYRPPRSSAFYLEQFAFRDLVADTGPATLVLVEGMGDALRVIESGYMVLGLFGTQMGRTQTSRLLGLIQNRRHSTRVVIAFDGDSAGRKAAIEVAVQLFMHCDVCIASLPEGKDPEDMPIPMLRSELRDASSCSYILASDSEDAVVFRRAMKIMLTNKTGGTEEQAKTKAYFDHKRTEANTDVESVNWAPPETQRILEDLRAIIAAGGNLSEVLNTSFPSNEND